MGELAEIVDLAVGGRAQSGANDPGRERCPHQPGKQGRRQTMRTVDPSLYTRRYYQTNCCGFDAFEEFDGCRLTARIGRSVSLALLAPNSSVLDFGCGRGELTIYMALSGHECHAVDYSSDAIAIATEKASDICRNGVTTPKFYHSDDLEFLEFPSNRFDAVFLLDVYEHLYPEQIDLLLEAVFRVLRPSGRLVIHTEPNRWLSSIANTMWSSSLARATLFRLLAALNCKDRLNDDHLRMHVNEQTPSTLRRALVSHGFHTRVWTTALYAWSDLRCTRTLLKKMLFHGFPLTAVWPLANYFNNNIWAVAEKPSKRRPRDE